MKSKNIVLFGQTGAGKSSVVNLIAGEEKAMTSLGTQSCSRHWTEHSIAFDGHKYTVFDTAGLEDPECGVEEYLEAIMNARTLIMKLEKEGGIDLLLFCVRAGRVTSTTLNNYRLVYEWLCEKKFPIVLVLTGLEKEQNMEDWWIRNKVTFDRYEISFDGHVCVTAANNLDGRHQELYQQSRQLVRNLVEEHTYGRPGSGWKGANKWFRRFMRKELLFRHNFIKNDDTVTVLTTRCGMPREAAVLLATRVRQA